MKGKTKRIIGALFASLALVAPLLVGASTFAQAEAENSTDTSLDASANTLGLADRSNIQLDEGEEWVDGETLSQYAIRANNEYVSCNNNCRFLNTVNNHFGLRSNPGHGVSNTGVGHAWAFTFEWYGDKGAYAIKAGYKAVDSLYTLDSRCNTMKYKDCTWKYLNLTDKKTSNQVKIKTWGIKNPQKKAEQLFWISKGPNGYRLWSALAGRPLGYTSDDKDNLKTLDNREAGTTQYFDLLEIAPGVCVDANAYFSGSSL